MNTKANTQTNKIRKAIASVAVVGFGITTLFTATAVASPGGGFGSSPFEPITPPSPSELILEESLDLESGIIIDFLDPAPEVETDPSNCGMFNFLDVTVTNEDTAEFFRVDVSNGSVEPSAEPVFEYEEVNYSENTGWIGSDAFETDTSEITFALVGNAVLVEVYEVSAPWSPEPWEKLVFDEEVYTAVDMTPGELDDWLDQLTTEQFQKIAEFFQTMPKLKHSFTVKNTNTGNDFTIVLEGLADFF